MSDTYHPPVSAHHSASESEWLALEEPPSDEDFERQDKQRDLLWHVALGLGCVMCLGAAWLS